MVGVGDRDEKSLIILEVRTLYLASNLIMLVSHGLEGSTLRGGYC